MRLLPPMPRSLTARLMLAALAGMAAAVVAVAILFPLSATFTSLYDSELAEQVDHVANGLRVGAGGGTVSMSPRNALTYEALLKDTAYWVTDAAGRTVAQSTEGTALAALRQLPPDVHEFSLPNPGEDILLRVATGHVRQAGQDYTVRVARSSRMVSTLNDYENRLYLRAGLVVMAIALGVFCAVVYFTVERMLRPLRRASEAAAHIEPRNLSARLRVDGVPTELKPLIEAFNAALARLEAGYRVQQEFLAAAAHELKTPLALLRAEIELGGGSNREMLLRDTDLMARQVHQLLHLAEVSEGHNYRVATVDPREVVADAAAYLARLAERRGNELVLQLERGPGNALQADAGALFVLVKNLLENALQHSPPGAAVTLWLGDDALRVSDAGPGVAAAERAALFKRFWRGPRSEGAGLGLAICREIADAHGWDIRLCENAAAAGASFELRFERTAPAMAVPA